MTIELARLFRLRVRRDSPESRFISTNAAATSSGEGFFPATCRTKSWGVSAVAELEVSAVVAEAKADAGAGFGSLEGGRFSGLRLAARRGCWSARRVASSVLPERSGFSVM